MDAGLKQGSLTDRDTHLCVDMQRMFDEDTAWHTPWLRRIVPQVARIARAHPEQTICTRFVPPRTASDAQGAWVRYYKRWSSMVLDRLGEEMIDLVPELAAIRPPLACVDKAVYSPWMEPALADRLRERGSRTVVVTGGETDICVLATVLGAIDRGFQVVIVRDALCSSADAVHDAVMKLYHDRFGEQVDLTDTRTVLDRWR